MATFIGFPRSRRVRPGAARQCMRFFLAFPPRPSSNRQQTATNAAFSLRFPVLSRERTCGAIENSRQTAGRPFAPSTGEERATDRPTDRCTVCAYAKQHGLLAVSAQQFAITPTAIPLYSLSELRFLVPRRGDPIKQLKI